MYMYDRYTPKKHEIQPKEYKHLCYFQLLSLSSEPKLLGEVNTTCRIICMDVYQPPYTPALDTDPAGLDEYASSEEEKEIKQEKDDSDEENGEQQYEEIKIMAEHQTSSHKSKSKLERKKHKSSQDLSSKTKKIRFK